MVQLTKSRKLGDGRSFEQYDYEPDGVLSTVSYVAILKIANHRARKGHIIVKNTHASNTVFYKILISDKFDEPADLNDDSWVDLVAETSLTGTNTPATSFGIKEFDGAVKWIWVAIKTNGGAGTIKAWSRSVN